MRWQAVDSAFQPAQLVAADGDLFGAGRTPQIGQRALVYDDTGEYEPLAVADELVSRGAEVTFATGFDSFGERIAVRASTAAPVLRRLAKAGVKLVIRAVLTEWNS